MARSDLQVTDFWLGDGNSSTPGRIGTLAGAMYGGAQASGAVMPYLEASPAPLDVLGQTQRENWHPVWRTTGTGGAASALCRVAQALAYQDR